MAAKFQRITPFFWFNDNAEDAATYYASVFPDSKLGEAARYTEEAARATGQKPGSVMTQPFELAGQQFTAINGGPHFTFNEAISLVVNCDSQAEIDHYWDKLGAGGPPQAQQCGWLKDRFGVSWQVVPRDIAELMSPAGDPARPGRVMAEVMKMKKIDLDTLRRAAKG